MKIFTWKTLIVLLAVLVTACNQGSLTQLFDQQGELLIWHPFQGKIAEIVNGAFQEFQHLTPGVEIVSEYVPQNELSSQFIKQAKDGFGPSIMIDFSRQIPDLVKAGFIQPIDEKTIDLSPYFSPTLTQIRYQGKIYALPLGSQTRVLCYNQGKIQLSRLTDDTTLIQPPTRLEGLIEQARKGYSVGMVSAFEDTFWGMGIFNVQWFDSQGSIKSLKLQGWAKWLEWLKQADNEPNFTLLRNREILHFAFAQGKLTYYICNSNEIADLKKDLKDNLRIAPLPQETDRPATPLLYTRVMMFNHSSGLDEMRLALQLAEFMTNPEQQVKAIVQSQAFIPINQSLKIDAQILPIEALLIQQSKTATAIPLDSIKQIMSIFEQGEILYQKAIAGNITPIQAALKLTEIVKAQIQ